VGLIAAILCAEIKVGVRFGVALTIIRAEDGLASPVSFFDLIRL
jgi:hypothetical protein